MKFLKRIPVLRVLLIGFGLWLGYWVVRGGYAVFSFRSGVADYHAQRYEGATRHFTNTLNVSPVDDAEIRYWRANALGLSGRVRESLVDFRRAAELEPKEPRYVEGLAHALWIVGRDGESLTVQRRAIQLSPRDAELRLVLGIRMWRSGAARGDILRELYAALAIDPSSPRARKVIEKVRSGARPMDDGRPRQDRVLL